MGFRKLFVFADDSHDGVLPKEGTGIKRPLAAGDPAPVISPGGIVGWQQLDDVDLQWRKNKIGKSPFVEFVSGFLDRPAQPHVMVESQFRAVELTIALLFRN